MLLTSSNVWRRLVTFWIRASSCLSQEGAGKASSPSMSFNHQAGLIPYPIAQGQRPSLKALLSVFPRTTGLRLTLSCSFTVTPPTSAIHTLHSSTAFSHRKYKAPPKLTPVQGWCRVNKTGLRSWGKDFCSVVTCFCAPCPEDQGPLTSFTMDLMSLLASCKSSGFLLFSSFAKSWKRRHLK